MRSKGTAAELEVRRWIAARMLQQGKGGARGRAVSGSLLIVGESLEEAIRGE